MIKQMRCGGLPGSMRWTWGARTRDLLKGMEKRLMTVNMGKLRRLVPPRPVITLARLMIASGAMVLRTDGDMSVTFTWGTGRSQGSGRGTDANRG